MEMNRRAFLQKMLAVGTGIFAAAAVLIKAVSPRRFLRAKPASKYPGRLKPLGDITLQSRWSG
jgi:hypothetical protein